MTVEEYAEGLRRWAAGDNGMSAAVEMLIEDGRWLRRADFQRYLRPYPPVDGEGPTVGIGLELLAVEYNDLVASRSEQFLLRTALALMGARVEVDLNDIVGCDIHITQAVCTALIRAAGKHRQMRVSLN